MSARAYAIAASSVRGEIPPEVIEVLAARGTHVALDVQGFMRILRGGILGHDPWPGKEAVLRHVTILKTDAFEAELLTGEADRAAAARRLAVYGPREVPVTNSAGVLLCHDDEITEAPFVPCELRGRSGRGDICAGAYLAKRLTASSREALFWSAAVTSLKLEMEGPFHREIAEVEVLYRRLAGQQSAA